MSEISIPLEKMPQFIDDMAQKQMPFACAMTLTKTSAAIGDVLAQKSAHQFHTLTPFSRTHRTARIGGKPSPGSSYATLPANKADGIDKMKATLGNQHWGIAQQIDVGSTVRKPKTSKYLWVPLQGRKRNFGPKKALQMKGAFIIRTQKGRMIVQRKGKSKTLIPLFLRRRQQTIKPRFHMMDVVNKRAQRYIDFFFHQSMEQALRTAKW